MISDRLKQLLKDHTDDLKNNNLDPIFKDIRVGIFHDQIHPLDLLEILKEQKIDIFKYITEIPAYYYWCYRSNTLDLSKYANIVSIGSRAFSSCRINTLVLPWSTRELNPFILSGSAIDDLNLPKGIEEIPINCFSNCTISELKIPNSVFRIYDSAFKGSEIDALYLPDSLKIVNLNSFKTLKSSKIFYRGQKYATKKELYQALKNNRVTITVTK